MTNINDSTINNPLWSGPRLLVPIFVDALMVGKKNQTGTWGNVGVRYDQLGLRGGQPQPSAFQEGSPPDTGIHLIWTLPNSMRHGQAQDDGNVDFPLIPNRWLITRSAVTQPGKPPTITAWVLESDFLGSQTEGTHVYPDPANKGHYYYIGRRFELADWQGATSEYDQPFLKAMGPGNATYVAIYDNMSNVLAFHDDMQGADSGTYSYSVCGWFAKPDQDLLFGKTPATPDGFTSKSQWQNLMTQLQWTVGSSSLLSHAIQDWQAWLAHNPITGGPALTDAQKTYPAQTLCHGMVYKLEWQGTNPPQAYPINAILSGNTPPQVAIAPNAPEAAAAWLAKVTNTPDAEDLLVAFQEDMVFDFGADYRHFKTESHSRRFETHDGGSAWVVQRPSEQAQGQIPAGNKTLALDPQATTTLTNLNHYQQQVDSSARELASLKWQLFAAYWKLENYPRTNPDWGNLSQKAIDNLQPQIKKKSADLKELTTLRDQQKATLEDLIKKEGLLLEKENAPRFFNSKDPVILIAGANQDTKLAPPGAFDSEPSLFTRFTGQTISGLEVSFTLDNSHYHETLTVDDLSNIYWPKGADIPKETADYWLETFFLDTTNAQFLAQLTFTKAGVQPSAAQLTMLTEQIQRQQTLAWNQNATKLVDPRAVGDVSGLIGVVPDKISTVAWTPPWTPIYLDWEIEWYPSASTPQEMLKQWQLGDVDFTWIGSEIAKLAGAYSGRSILNEQTSTGLQQKLNDFIDHNPNLDQLPSYQVQALKDMALKLGQFDVLTQALSGFTLQLIMQLMEMSKLSSAQQETIAEMLNTDVSYIPDAANTLFYPIFAGHFKLTRLEVVDAFGQILSSTQIPEVLQPIRAKSYLTPGTENKSYMQLPPRISQGMQLDFRLVDSNNDGIPSNSSNLTSPICGWVLPNHLDNSLIVFDAKGNNKGEVITIDKEKGTGLLWDPVPGKNTALGAPPDLDNQHLQNFISTLLGRGATGSDALNLLLDVIDSSLWKTDPLGQPQTGNLSILLGRPIAVVRTLISLQLQGPPASNQNWNKTGQAITDNFAAVPFQVKVGDIGVTKNGVMGYFLDDDYSQLYPYQGFDAELGIARRIMSESHLSANDILPTLQERLAKASDTVLSSQDDYIVKNPTFELTPDGKITRSLTLLVDPRGWIPAITGALPLQYLKLSSSEVESALNTMFATFRTGPVLVDPQQVHMPLPAQIKGKWTWVEQSGVTVWRDEALKDSDAKANLPSTRPTLSEGWLKLSGAISAEDINH